MSEENAVESKIIINKGNYVASRTSTGGKSLSNGDQVAVALEGMTTEEVYEVANSLIPDNDYTTKYAHLNAGMQRMNVGNRIRGFVNKRDKENDEIDVFNEGRGQDVEEKSKLPDAGDLFNAASDPVKVKVAERVAAKAAEKEASEAERAAEKEAKKAAKVVKLEAKKAADAEKAAVKAAKKAEKEAAKAA